MVAWRMHARNKKYQLMGVMLKAFPCIWVAQ